MNDKILAALLSAVGTAAAALASSTFGRIAPSIRGEQVLSLESKRLALLEAWLRIKSQYISNDAARSEIDKAAVPILESILRSLTDLDTAKEPNFIRFIQDWLLLRKPSRSILWPLYVIFYAAFVISFVLLKEEVVGSTFFMITAFAALCRLLIGLIEGHLPVKPKA